MIIFIYNNRNYAYFLWKVKVNDILTCYLPAVRLAVVAVVHHVPQVRRGRRNVPWHGRGAKNPKVPTTYLINEPSELTAMLSVKSQNLCCPNEAVPTLLRILLWPPTDLPVIFLNFQKFGNVTSVFLFIGPSLMSWHVTVRRPIRTCVTWCRYSRDDC